MYKLPAFINIHNMNFLSENYFLFNFSKFLLKISAAPLLSARCTTFRGEGSKGHPPAQTFLQQTQHSGTSHNTPESNNSSVYHNNINNYSIIILSPETLKK
jgi:hypothetical protein